MTTSTARIATSTWSLHRMLERGDVALLDIPAQAAAHGLDSLEICHFHFPSTDPGYIADLRGAFTNAGISFLTLLIDDFDLTHPEPPERERALEAITGWLAVASQCGAERARVIAGKQPPTDETLGYSVNGFEVLAHRANHLGVRLFTENWHALLARPAEVLALLERVHDRLEPTGIPNSHLGLKVDFGNWSGPSKYDELAQIMPHAEDTHAKAHYPAVGQMDRADFVRCLGLCQAAGFTGPHSLIFDGPIDDAHDEWASLDQMREVVHPSLGTPTGG